ncbi:MAG: hypothetical protein GY928_21250, partial [Colwellia sp.]|nr:hypothetical protein [Colwellia sp.]
KQNDLLMKAIESQGVVERSGFRQATPRPQKLEVVVTAKEDWVDAKINDSQNWMGDGIYN